MKLSRHLPAILTCPGIQLSIKAATALIMQTWIGLTHFKWRGHKNTAASILLWFQRDEVAIKTKICFSTRLKKMFNVSCCKCFSTGASLKWPFHKLWFWHFSLYSLFNNFLATSPKQSLTEAAFFRIRALKAPLYTQMRHITDECGVFSFNADWNENMDEDSGFEKWNQYTIGLNLHSFQFVSRQQLLWLQKEARLYRYL